MNFKELKKQSYKIDVFSDQYEIVLKFLFPTATIFNNSFWISGKVNLQADSKPLF